MTRYQVVFSKVAAKEIRLLPKTEIKRIFEKSKQLEDNPYPAGCKKLIGEKEELWRLRVGSYRIIYSVNESIYVIDIRRVGHRKDIYNK